MAQSAADTQAAYEAAYEVVSKLIRLEGENKVWRRVIEHSR
jgi:hypothetical protein